MALDFCSECLSAEGDWDVDDRGKKIVCLECGAEESYLNLPEKDAFNRLELNGTVDNG